MGDYSYQKQMGITDEYGNLTHQGKINRVHGVVGRFGISERECMSVLSSYAWDMDAAIEHFMMTNNKVYNYVNSHHDQVQQLLYHDSSADESVAKFMVEHPHVTGAAKAAPKAIEGLVGGFFVVVFVVILAFFGL